MGRTTWRAFFLHIEQRLNQSINQQTAEAIWSFEVPRAVPIVYHFDAAFRPLRTGAGGGAAKGGMALPPQITATVLLPSAEDEDEWAARLPSNS